MAYSPAAPEICIFPQAATKIVGLADVQNLRAADPVSRQRSL
jgi:hypothetical protein